MRETIVLNTKQSSDSDPVNLGNRTVVSEQMGKYGEDVHMF